MHRILVKSNRKSAVAGTIYPGLNPIKIHEKFVTENVALGRVSYEHIGAPLPFTIPPVPHSNQSAWAGARDILKAAVTSPTVPLPLRIHPNSHLLDVKTITLHLYTSFCCQVCKYLKTKIFHEIEARMT